MNTSHTNLTLLELTSVKTELQKGLTEPQTRWSDIDAANRRLGADNDDMRQLLQAQHQHPHLVSGPSGTSQGLGHGPFL